MQPGDKSPKKPPGERAQNGRTGVLGTGESLLGPTHAAWEVWLAYNRRNWEMVGRSRGGRRGSSSADRRDNVIRRERVSDRAKSPCFIDAIREQGGTRVSTETASSGRREDTGREWRRPLDKVRALQWTLYPFLAQWVRRRRLASRWARRLAGPDEPVAVRSGVRRFGGEGSGEYVVAAGSGGVGRVTGARCVIRCWGRAGVEADLGGRARWSGRSGSPRR